MKILSVKCGKECANYIDFSYGRTIINSNKINHLKLILSEQFYKFVMPFINSNSIAFRSA
ncbi:MAG TPA: hypothetical protein DCQ50_12495 [Chryseobacterium sp.]|nr:hypothetical protein [Chryseobacterium sp.]